MKITFLKLIGIVAVTSLVNTARAELKWEQTSVDLHPAIGDKQAIAHFKYENVGKTAVHFKSVHASCGCTTAQTQTDEVAPGEKGEITATFNIGGRTGMQVKTVNVQTDDPDPAHANIVLTLKADIAQLLQIQPAFVYWQIGEEPKPKVITAKANKDAGIKKLDVASSTPDFTGKVDAGASLGEFRISVQPRDTSKPIYTTLTIKSDSPAGTANTFAASARVLPGPATSSASTPASQFPTVRHNVATPAATASSPSQ
jgi:Protein of unknown function (DUF1573)